MLYGAEHVKRYVETGGREGHDWRGAQVLILTTTGRRTGKQHSTPLIYGRDGENYTVVASLGGAPDHPQWYKNLVADPTVRVQVKADVFTAEARTATEEEKARLWPEMARIWPDYDDYQAKTERSIPLVILRPV
ncbi:nitroreductase family deazaflavin-dependent oxidoreductase [Marinactinospora rubrisoli]|uniref:Nitroreductase family deazaflavin-dependent oxidoreductase n=1 Tax=Marinactinospora rubrisoli TaxID=2715399 RepID=A0ABW2KDM4_9ACTN